MSTICHNLTSLLEKISLAATLAGRDPKKIKLVAVSKTVAAPAILEAIACGQVLFGENYLQEASEKIPILPSQTQWHFIGRLQSNKCRQVVELFDMVETIDRPKLANRLNFHAEELGHKLKVLVQVNIGRETQKAGVLPEQAASLISEIANKEHLECRGLMALPPFFDNPEASRPYFKQLKELADTCARQGLFHDNEQVELSMGMSGDYLAAIEEGATIVRIGTAIFGTRL